MTVKLFGALLVLLSCGGYGFLIAASHRVEVKCLQSIIHALDLMECELQYRLTPLPELCRIGASVSTGGLKQFFCMLSNELNNQISPNVAVCISNVLSVVKLPRKTTEVIELLGRSLGRFDVDGQMKGLRYVKAETERILAALMNNQDVRLRSYQTLGLCAGAAIVILLV